MSSPTGPQRRARPTNPATERRSRRARGSLSTDRLIETALAILDRDGLTGLSMPRLAAALDCGTMSLYSHVANKQSLLELILAKALTGLPDPEPTTGPGDLRWLISWAGSIRESLVRHRGVSAILSSCAFPTEAVRGQLTAVTSGLVRQGVTAEGADRALHAVVDVILGMTNRLETDGSSAQEPDAGDARFAYAITALVTGLEQQLFVADSA